MKVAIAGTRGIPNNYGGFEQCAEFLSVMLTEKGHEVIVYNSHDHPYSSGNFGDVTVRHKFNPEKRIGAAGNFIYDYLCLRDAIRDGVDVVLMLGYTTASIFYPLLDFRNTTLVTNMDGLEWKRDKWSDLVKKLALWFENLAAKYSHHHVADNAMIQSYLKDKYGIESYCIPYGSEVAGRYDPQDIRRFDVADGRYSLVIARLEAENNISMILQGYTASELDEPLLIIGNVNTRYGEQLRDTYTGNDRVKFIGGVYDLDALNALRSHCRFYFHGHSVGGTNPSLLEAMASGCMILAHGNEFNKWVTGEDALYFTDAEHITVMMNDYIGISEQRKQFSDNNHQKIRGRFSWKNVAAQYENMFLDCLSGQAGEDPVRG